MTTLQKQIRLVSSRNSVTDERPQARQGIGGAREIGVELAPLALPRRAQVVVVLETGHVRLAAESHREILVAAGHLDDRARGNRRAVAESDAQRRSVRPAYREVEHQSAAVVRLRYHLELFHLGVQRQVVLL